MSASAESRGKVACVDVVLCADADFEIFVRYFRDGKSDFDACNLESGVDYAVRFRGSGARFIEIGAAESDEGNFPVVKESARRQHTLLEIEDLFGYTAVSEIYELRRVDFVTHKH